MWNRNACSARSQQLRSRAFSRLEGLEERLLLTTNLPVATNDLYVVNANEVLAGASVLLNDYDIDGEIVDVAAAVRLTLHGSLSLAMDGTFTYAPLPGFVGFDSFTYVAGNGFRGEFSSDPAVVTIQVGTPNTAPFAFGQVVSTAVDTRLSGQLSAIDPNGNPLTFWRGTVHTAHGMVFLNTAGAFNYTPNLGYAGPDTFTFKVSDGTTESAEATVSINVFSPDNQIPIAESTEIRVSPGFAFQGRVTGMDADYDPLTYSLGSIPPSHGSLDFLADGQFTYTSLAGFDGPDFFTFVANDGSVNSAEAGVSITVGGMTRNAIPVAFPATISTLTNVQVAGQLLAADADHDPLIYLGGSIAPRHGSVIINSSGSFTYTPNFGFTGIDKFSFQVNDGRVTSAEAIETIHVGGAINIVPVANPAVINTEADATFIGVLTGFDVDNDPLVYSAGTIGPCHGVVGVSSDGTFQYTPDPGFMGCDTFSFRVYDGDLFSAEAIVTVQVLSAIDAAPIAVSGSATTVRDVPLHDSLTPLVIDIEGDPLTFVAVTQPAHGTLLLSTDGTFLYTPAIGFIGTDSFTFQASDGAASSNTAIFTLIVNPQDPFVLTTSAVLGVIGTNRRTAVPLDATASITNVSAGVSFAHATVKVSLLAGSNPKDKLFVLPGGGQLVARRKQLFYQGKLVAQINGGGLQSLVIAFNANANAAAVNTVLRQIAARTAGRTAGPRTIRISVKTQDASSSATIAANLAAAPIPH